MPTPNYGARTADLLGEGTLDPAAVSRPAITQEELDRRREGQRIRNERMGLDANGNPLPAYGTPTGQGGTATGTEVTIQAPIGTGQMAQTTTVPLGTRDQPLVGGVVRDRTYQAGVGLRSTGPAGTVVADPGNAAQAAQSADAIQADIARRAGGEGADALQIAQQNNRNVNAGTGAAADRAAGALGPAPTVDQGLADRQLGAYEEALGMSREVLDALLNGPSTAERSGARTLKNQLALARSARGGPGAVQQAMATAQQGAPELQAQAAESARQEEMQRLTAAGNVASNFAQAALGARGQDIDIAKKNVDAATAFTGMIANLTGIQLELDQRNQELLGQLARDVAATGSDYAQLDAQMASAELDRLRKRYGIDEQTRVQIMAIEAEGKITAKDILNGAVGIIGSAAGIGAAAAGKK